MIIRNDFINNENSMKALDMLLAKPLPAKAAYAIAKIQTACEKQSKKFFPEYVSMLTKYCHMNEDGTFKEMNGKDTYTVKEELKEEFMKVAGELLNQTFEVSKVEPLSPELFGDCELEPAIIKALLPILK
jgi:hypothetical protein